MTRSFESLGLKPGDVVRHSADYETKGLCVVVPNEGFVNTVSWVGTSASVSVSNFHGKIAYYVIASGFGDDNMFELVEDCQASSGNAKIV